MQHGLGLMSSEVYLELFGLAPEEIFPHDVRQRIAVIAQRIEDGKEDRGKSITNVYAFAHVMALRKGQYSRAKQKRKDKKGE